MWAYSGCSDVRRFWSIDSHGADRPRILKFESNGLCRIIVGWLSSVRFASLRRKEFVCFGGDRHEHRGRDAEPFGELGDLVDVYDEAMRVRHDY